MTNEKEEYGGSFCKCPPKDKHGQTAVMCCNHCGMPDEPFWQPPTDAVEEGEEITEHEMSWLLRLREYFGENDKTQFEHSAYHFLDNLIKKLKSQYKLIKK